MLKVLQLSQTRGSSEMKNAIAFLRNHSDEQVLTMIDSLEEGNVKYSTWKRVEIEDGKKKMNLVMVDIPKEEFKLIFIDTMHTYLERISN
jgi:ribosomal protein RSM22 (predicted rRNA methylase)